MSTSHLKHVQSVPTNIAGVRAISPAAGPHATDHAAIILATLALAPHGAASDALQARIRSRAWPSDACIVPHLVPRPGVTHRLTPARELADTAYTSSNWAGSTIPGTWTNALGIWRVPSVGIPDTPAGTDGGWESSSWVGIDGTYGSNDVLQAGVRQSVGSDGSATYHAWYEWYAPQVAGSPSYIYETRIGNIEIQPGDEVFAGIYYRGGTGLVMFGNVDRGRYFRIEIDPPPGASMSGNSAEWIMEAPDSGEPGTSLPAFSPVVFSTAMATPAVFGADSADPAKGDSVNISVGGRTLTNVALGSYSVTITRAAAPWQSFEVAGAGSASAHGIAAVSRVPGGMELWFVAANGSIQDRYWYEGGGSWQGFELAPPGSAAPASAIAAVSRIPGSMELWWIAPDGSVQGAYWYEGAGWGRYELAPPHSASPTGGIAAVSRIPGGMEVWFTGADGSIQDRFWYEGGTWQGFALAPAGTASLAGGLAATSRIDSSMELWFVGANGSIQDRSWYEGGGWQGFELAPAGSAAPSTAIAAVSRVPGSMELWFVGSNGSVQDRYWYEGGSWQGFELAPAGSASPAGGLAAVSRIGAAMELWFVGANGSIQDRFWYEGNDWSGFELAPAGSAALGTGIAAVSRVPGSMEFWHATPNGAIKDHVWYG